MVYSLSKNSISRSQIFLFWPYLNPLDGNCPHPKEHGADCIVAWCFAALLFKPIPKKSLILEAVICSHVEVLRNFAAVRFSYVSTFQVLDPKDMAQNLRKQALVASLVDTLGANELA